MKKETARQIALETLLEIEKFEGYSNRVLNRRLNKSSLEPTDRRLTTKLVYGILENRNLLDHIIRQYINFRINKLNPAIRNILRMGIYQIVFMENIPDSAAVNEAVKLAKEHKKQYSGFVNGVLRNFLREDKAYKLPNREKDLLNHLTVVYSHPNWIVEKWLKRFGEEFTEALLKCNNETPPLYARVNTLKTTRDKLVESLENEGFSVECGVLSDSLIVKTENAGSLAHSEAFINGEFTIQDVAAMAVGHVVSPKPGQFIIDMCAAPGGKTTHMATLMEDQGTVLAWDIYDHKIEKIQENIDRLGLNSISPELKDALIKDENLVGKADVVLIDAPCSGLGIIRRKPEIKFNKESEDILALSEIQSEMLDVAADYVKPGGSLVYSTCTIEPEENEDQVQAFLNRHPEFLLEKIEEGILPESWSNEKDAYITLYPHIHGTDGFFICKMVKKD